MPNWTDENGVSHFPEHLLENNMAPRAKRKTTTTIRTRILDMSKPTLVVVGESMVDPKDVAAIKKIRSKDDLYIIILKSQPNMEFPMWANAEEVAALMKHFNIVE